MPVLWQRNLLRPNRLAPLTNVAKTMGTVRAY